jgi:hypothetical protein
MHSFFITLVVVDCSATLFLFGLVILSMFLSYFVFQFGPFVARNSLVLKVGVNLVFTLLSPQIPISCPLACRSSGCSFPTNGGGSMLLKILCVTVRCDRNPIESDGWPCQVALLPVRTPATLASYTPPSSNRLQGLVQ